MTRRENLDDKDIEVFSENITKNLLKKVIQDEQGDTSLNKQSENLDENDKNLNKNEFNTYNDTDTDKNHINKNIPLTNESITNTIKSPKKYTKQENKKGTLKNTKRESNDRRGKIEQYGQKFFDDDYEYEDNAPSLVFKFINISIIVVLAICTSVLALSLKSTKIDLANTKQALQDLKDENEQTKIKIMQENLKNQVANLELENETLKKQINNLPQNATNDNQQSNTQSDTQSKTQSKIQNNTQSNTQNNNSQTQYIVKEGDIVWNISKNIYGSGAHYKKILDANNLKEDAVLVPGEKLIIPKIN